MPNPYDPSQRPWTPVVFLIVLVLAIGTWLLWSRAPVLPAGRGVTHAPMALSAETRARLRPRMHRHSEAMMKLTDAVMALDDDRVARAATSLLEDSQLVQPLSASAASPETNLPPVFRELEGRLRIKTEALRAAAQAHDGERLTAAHAELAWTCAECHAAFAGP